MSKIKKYIFFLDEIILSRKNIYFIGNNAEESQYWKIHVNVNSITEANNLMKGIKQDGTIVYNISNKLAFLPQFRPQQEKIEALNENVLLEIGTNDTSGYFSKDKIGEIYIDNPYPCFP
jgi:hypothetical protein